MRIALDCRSLGARATVSRLHDGGYFHIFKGARVAGPLTAYIAANVLATLILPSPSFTESGGAIIFADLEGTALRNGIAAWGRFADTSDLGVVDLSIGGVPPIGVNPLPGDPVFDMLFIDPTFSATGPVSLRGYTLTFPEGI